MPRASKPFTFQTTFARSPQGFAGKALTLLLTAAVLVLAVMFSLVALAIAAIGGLFFAGWFWWKTRALRRAMRDAAPSAAAAAERRPPDGEIIEGECVREGPPREQLLPRGVSASSD